MRKVKNLVAIALLTLTTSISAAEIWNHPFPVAGSLRWNGFDTGSTSVNVSKTNAPPVSYNGRGGQFGGFFYADGVLSADEFFRFFCIDLFQTADAGPHAYSASLYSNGVLARLYDIVYPNKAVGDFFNGASTTFGQFASNIRSSAFQLAVWEIFYESTSTFSLSGGSFISNTSANGAGADDQQAVALANTWLADINSGRGSATAWTLYRFTSDTRQDYVSAVYRPNTVAEPGTFALLGLGALALGALRRRRHS